MIGVIGLGLVGGSMAKALNQNTDHTVYGFDINDTVSQKAKLVNAIEDVLTDEMLPACDVVVVALYPAATIDYVKSHGDLFKKGAIVFDCCGVKEVVCNELEPLAKEKGFVFMGGHPMAGIEHSGFEYSKKALFDNASMILVPAKDTRIEDIEYIRNLCKAIGFTTIQMSTPKEHDRMIAFTSQLPHVISGAYIKSDTAEGHQGYSAGSYWDMSRVAKLNEDMWTELFLDNPQFLVSEIKKMTQRLNQYGEAIATGDRETLRRLLRDGRMKKEAIDKEFF
jgi:prephenate dehydrogenase